MLAIGWGNTWQHQRCDMVGHDTPSLAAMTVVHCMKQGMALHYRLSGLCSAGIS